MRSTKNWKVLGGSPISRNGNSLNVLTKMKTKKPLSQNNICFFPLKQQKSESFNVTVEGRTFPSCAEPTYLGMQLDRRFTFRRYLKSRHEINIKCWIPEATGSTKLENLLQKSYTQQPWHSFTPLLNFVRQHGVIATTLVSSTSRSATNYEQ